MLGNAGEVAMSMRLPVLQGTTPVTKSLRSFASAVPSTHAAARITAAASRAGLDAIGRSECASELRFGGGCLLL